MNDAGLLKGIKVIDLTRVLAGPYCTMMLGDLGADVIKVESPGKGDDTRQWGPPFTQNGESAYFLSANRNKRSITLNLKSENGLAVLKDLIEHGDVLVENFKAGTLERMGLSYLEMKSINPKLIYCTITGYGYTGPYSDRPGYDFMAQALGGMMSITGPQDGDPVRVGIAITDLMTGIFAANAIMAALVSRQNTGHGERIDMSLLDTQVASLSYVASNFLISGEDPNRYGNGHPNIVPYQSFKARDKHFAIAAGNDGQWAKLCEAMGKHEWKEDERYTTNANRVKNREELIPHLEREFLQKDAAEWMAICDEIGIPSAPINSISDVFANEQVISRERVIMTSHPETGEIPLVASAMNIPSNPTVLNYPPPLLGEHTNEILSQVLGYTAERISELEKDGLI